MTFAGGFFAEEIEDRVAIMFVVQIEVSFVSTRRESDKPEKINISVLSGCCLYNKHCIAIKHFRFGDRLRRVQTFFVLYLFQCRCLSFRSATFGCHENSDPGKQ